MSNTESIKTTVEWEITDWRKLERTVFKLQKRIYQASQRGENRTVRRLQKTLMKSKSARMLAVRRVTQENQGKKTAGVDGVSSLTPKQRMALANQLRQLNYSYKAKPVRRVWIDKPGRTEKRPLGIPTMHDRASQALVKAALEPEWEAKFEPNSYGFRPGRSCHDAIEAIYASINKKPKWVLDADIAKCFDRINHEALLKKLNTSPTIRRLIKCWLKAGVIDWSGYANRKQKKVTSQTLEGTPQGGVISPLLANIALHGLEKRLLQYIETITLRYPNGKTMGKKDKRSSLGVVRYADDFVVLHEDIAIVQKCQQITVDWLKDMSLELKPEKTPITHTLNTTTGFNFLGFNIRQFEVGRNASKRGYKTIITPSKEALKLQTSKIGIIIEGHKNAPKAALISRLNPVIRGWCNYYRGQSSKDTFQKADFITYKQLRGWASCRHKRHSGKSSKEWKSIDNRKWVFATQEGLFLINHSDTKVVRHTKVEGVKSPYDGDWIYWSARKGDYPGVKKQLSELLKIQGGKCEYCGLYFSPDSLAEIHHKDSNHKNNKRDNLGLVHKHCHDQLHAKSRLTKADRDISIIEEWIDDHPF
ncbi:MULTISPECIES: group II intron reverse transcriptase/maturase [unclassified Microcoleus]|uniref:group II intron reverse transcriptase/maturase n=1 Tax=unclassified Microcoleus TaxID=2642155 RepID=UPI002FD7916B